MADGVFEVGVGRQGVAAGGVETGVAEEFGDDDDVDARAQEVGRQGVPQGVGGKGEGARVVEDVGVGGKLVHELVDRPGRQTPAAAIEEQRRGVGAGPGGAVGAPLGDGGPRGAVQERDLAGGLALAGADDDLAFARRERNVVVQSDEFGDPDPGVEQQPADGAVAARGRRSTARR